MAWRARASLGEWAAGALLAAMASSACGGRLGEDAAGADDEGAGQAGSPASDGQVSDGAGLGAVGSGGAPAAGGASGGATGGSAAGGTGGEGGWLVGQDCGTPDAIACAGPAQALLVQCLSGIWQEYGTCQSGQLCSSLTGACSDPAPGCANASPGALSCDSNGSIWVCGPDLVTRELFFACSFCEEDHCICLAGTHGNDAEMTSCSECALGTYSSGQNATGCTEWTNCSGHLIETPGSAVSDVVCGDPVVDLGTDTLDATGVVVSPEDEVVVVGLTDAGLGDTNVFVEKFDELGANAWTRVFGTTSLDAAYAVALDAAGGVYVGGFTGGSLEGSSAGAADAFLRKYDADGGEVWTRQFGGNGDDVLRAILVTELGHVYVAGVIDSLAEDDVAPGDAFVRKYDLDGSEEWTRVFGTPATDWAWGLALGPSGDVYVAGTTDGALEGSSGGVPDAFLRRYDQLGTEQWTKQLADPGEQHGRGVAIDAEESSYVLVQDFGYPPYLLWSNPLGESQGATYLGAAATTDLVAVVHEPGAGFYIAGTTTDAFGAAALGAPKPFVRHDESFGVDAWTRHLDLGGSDYINALAVGSYGQAYVVGRTDVLLPSSGRAFLYAVLPP